MKKTKFIAGAMVLSLGLLGTGYAYWTDSLQVNTTVSTGTFNLEFEPACTTNHVTDADGNWVNNEYQESTITMDQDSQVMNLKVDNMYPGSRVDFFYDVTNESTIPMILDNLTVTGVDDVYGFLVGFQAATEDDSYYMEADSTQSLGAQLESVLQYAYESMDPKEYNGTRHNISIEMLGETNTDKTNQGENFTAEISLDWKQENAN